MMATGAMLATGAAGIAGGMHAGKKAEASNDAANRNMNMGLVAIHNYMEQANIHGENALEFSQGMLADWEETFGGIEDNLSNYYKNLDPAKYSQQYKTNLNENIDKQLYQMNETMAATGLQTAGMAQQTAKEAAFAKAQGGAQADLMAEDRVRSMQQGFVNTGANRLNSANSSIFNAHSNLANTATNAASMAGNMFSGSANIHQEQANQHAADASGYFKSGTQGLIGGTTSLFGAESDNDALAGFLG